MSKPTNPPVKPKRPKTPGSGRKKGSTNLLPQEIQYNVVATLRKLGFDPIATHAQLFRETLVDYQKHKKRKNQFGVNGTRDALIRINGDIMKYCYPTLKAVMVDGTNDQKPPSFTEIIGLFGGTEDEEDGATQGPIDVSST